MQGAAKVGLLVIVFLALLYGGYAILGQSFVKQKTNTYFADFPDAGGTAPGTRVLMAGVKIGSVKAVRLMGPSRARMTLEVEEQVQIPEGSSAVLPGSLIGFGDNPIQIVPPAHPTSGILANGDLIQGSKASPLDSILPDSKQTVKELNSTLVATRKLLEDQGLKSKMEKLIDSSAKTLDKFGGLADKANGLLGQTNTLMAQSQPTLIQTLKSASGAMADIHKSTTMLAKLIESGKFQDQAMVLLKQLNATAAKADKMMGELSALVTDPEMQAHLKSTVANVDKMTDSGTRIAANTEIITKNGIELTEKANKLADSANAIAEEAHTALAKITGFFNRGPSKSPIPPVDITLDLMRESNPSHWRTDLAGRFKAGNNFVDVGLYDAFESNKIIAQYGSPLGKSGDYRYGIYASKPGVGVDFRLAPRVSLRGDLFDINKPRFDLRTQLNFGNGFVGWLGVERLFDRNAPSFGIGIRK